MEEQSKHARPVSADSFACSRPACVLWLSTTLQPVDTCSLTSTGDCPALRPFPIIKESIEGFEKKKNVKLESRSRQRSKGQGARSARPLRHDCSDPAHALRRRLHGTLCIQDAILNTNSLRLCTANVPARL
jgi:hypothetical protein